ncbi:MAG: DUF3857 domain-containing protein, partial [Mucilaginibacter sp.]
MNKFLSLLILSASILSANAQTAPVAQPYGKVDQADLEMKTCDFEKDANAEVLIDKGNLYYGPMLLSITEEVHKRIKIFNDKGTGAADVHIEYYSGNQLEYITGLQAETINLVDGKVEIVKLDKKSFFTKLLDKDRSEITFTFPNVKPGCIVEYKYNFNSNIYYEIPDWYFQEKIPVRYSELTTSIPDVFYFRQHSYFLQPLSKKLNATDTRSMLIDGEAYSYDLENNTWGMSNIPSLPDEPYMSSAKDNLQCQRFQLVSVKPIGGFNKSFSDTWAKVGGLLIDDDDFGGQLKRKVNNEDVIINKAKSLKTDDDKIAYVFNEVKNAMKWNGIDRWYTSDGTYRAWENKTGNSTEINLILYHLLKQSGLEAYPMVVSTRSHGKVAPLYTSRSQFNRTVVYIPVDSTRNYILDATGKYNQYNETPEELLNSSGLYVDKSKSLYDIIYLKNNIPASQVVFINAEVKAGGKLEGTAQVSSTSYNRIDAKERYKTDGEKKYTDYLSNNDNNLKISSLTFENMDVDTLPLMQKIAFSQDLAGSDENYIYLNPNLFS